MGVARAHAAHADAADPRPVVGSEVGKGRLAPSEVRNSGAGGCGKRGTLDEFTARGARGRFHKDEGGRRKDERRETASGMIFILGAFGVKREVAQGGRESFIAPQRFGRPTRKRGTSNN